MCLASLQPPRLTQTSLPWIGSRLSRIAAGGLAFLLIAGTSPRLAAQAAAQAPPPAAAATPAAGQTFSLNLMEAPGGVVVDLVDFVRMLESLYPGARSRWDAQRGMVRIEVSGHRFDALTGQKIVILDGKIQNVARALTVRGDRILLPVESVQAMLKGLNLDFELQTKGTPAPAPTPGAAPATAPAAVAATPLAAMPPGSIATPNATPVATPAIESLPTTIATTAATDLSAPSPANPAAPSVNLGVLVGEKPAESTSLPLAGNKNLEPPAGIKPQVGLTWKQLADRRHRIPPERIVIVCDAALEGVANGVKERLNKEPIYQAQTIVAASTRRDQDSLRKRIDAAEPELLFDLMAQSTDGDKTATGLTVWTVHSALWPADRETAATEDDPARRYKAHEFQNLAVGSLLRGELAAQFPELTSIYELAPEYLLRRTDAPAAAVLIPVVEEGGTGRKPALDEERLANAIAAAAVDYADGIRGAN